VINCDVIVFTVRLMNAEN